jgi:tripartite-type tricarboxylate transporter receptor subunit TctC
MKIPRRALLCLVANTAALTTVSRIAGAQTYPSRPVRIIVGFAAGRGSDITARLIGQSLSERLASNASLRIDRGRNTLLLASVEGAVNVTLYERLNCNFIRDIAAVAGIIRAPYVILVNPSFPAKTVPEFIAYAKANPGKVNMASGGVGSGNHLSGELFKMMTGVNMIHVLYRGQGPALSDLLGAQVQVLFATTPGTTEYVRAGTLHKSLTRKTVESYWTLDINQLSEKGYL